jgi:hypothetical protein
MVSVATLGVLLATAGCVQTFDATTLGVEATMASAASAPAEGERFSVSKKSVFLLFGMLSASRPSLQDILAAQVTGDAHVADLRVRVRSRWSDVLFTVLTAGLVVPRTITFEGVVVGQ